MVKGIQIREVPTMTTRTCCRSVFNYLFLVGMMFSLFLLYRSSPSLFCILISFSPLLLCTLLLLGILLTIGELSVPEIENEENYNLDQEGESLAIDKHSLGKMKCIGKNILEENWKTISICRTFPRIVYRTVCDHPFIFGVSCFFFIVNRSLPFLVSILVTLSPVFVCAVILLGVVLSFGEANTPESDIIQEVNTIIPHAVLEDNEVTEDVTSVHFDGSFTAEIYMLKRDEGKRLGEKQEDFEENMSSWKVKCEKWLSQEVQAQDEDLELEDENPMEQNKCGDEEWFILEMEDEGTRVENDKLLLDIVTNQGCLEAFKQAGTECNNLAAEGNEIINRALDNDDCVGDYVDSFSNFPSNEVDSESLSVLKYVGTRDCAGGDIHDFKNLEDSSISRVKKHDFLNDDASPSIDENSRKIEPVHEVPITVYPGHVPAAQIHDQDDVVEQGHCCIKAQICESTEEVKCLKWKRELVTAGVPQVEDTMKMIGETEETQESKYRKESMSRHLLVPNMEQDGLGNTNMSESVDSESYEDAEDNANQDDDDNCDEQGSYKSAITWGENDEKNEQCHESLFATVMASENMNFMAKKLMHLVSGDHLSENSSHSIHCESYDLPYIVDCTSSTCLLNQDPIDLSINSTEEKTDLIEDSSENTVMMRHQRQESSFVCNLQEEKPTFICDGCKQKFTVPHHKNTFFRRVKSFDTIPSGLQKQERLETSCMPYFVPEKLSSEGTKVFSFHRFSEPNGELGQSMVTSVHETEPIFSPDPKDMKLSGSDIFYETEMFLDLDKFYEHVKLGSQSFDKADVTEIEQSKCYMDSDLVDVKRENSQIPQEVIRLCGTRNFHVKFGRSDIQLAAEFAEEEQKKSNLSSSTFRSDAERETNHDSSDVQMGLSKKLQKVKASMDATRGFLTHVKSGQTEIQLPAESAEEEPDKSSLLSSVRNARRDPRCDGNDLQTGGSSNLQEELTSVNATRDTSTYEEPSRSSIQLAAASVEADCGDSCLVSLVLRRNAERDSKHKDIDAEMWYSRSLQQVEKSMADHRYISNNVASDEGVIRSATGSVEVEHGKSGPSSSVLRKYDRDVEHGGIGVQMGHSSCKSKVETSLNATRGHFNLVKSTRGEIQLAAESAEEECDISSLSFSILKKDANKKGHGMIDAQNGHSRNVRKVETSWAATRNIFNLANSRKVEAQVAARSFAEAQGKTSISSSVLRRNAVCDMVNRNMGQGQPFRLKNGTLQIGFAENNCTVNHFVPCSLFPLKPLDEDNYDHKDGKTEEDDSSDSRSSCMGSSSSATSVDDLINDDDSDEKSSGSSSIPTEDCENLEETTRDEDDDDDDDECKGEVACTNRVQLVLLGFHKKSGYLLQQGRNRCLFSRTDCYRTSTRKLISKREVII